MGFAAIVSGLTASGKTTLTGILARLQNVGVMCTSDFFIENLAEDRSKAQRLLSWTERENTQMTDREFALAIAADRMHLGAYRRHTPAVHESLALPMLLTEVDARYSVYLQMSEKARIQRLQNTWQLDRRTATTVCTRKDAQTMDYVRRRYQLELESEQHLSLFGYVVAEGVIVKSPPAAADTSEFFRLLQSSLREAGSGATSFTGSPVPAEGRGCGA